MAPQLQRLAQLELRQAQLQEGDPLMAKILFATPVAGLRGTINGVVYTAGKAGPYARGWYRSSNPRTTSQSQCRGNLATLPEAWRGLSSTIRTNWNTYAALPAQERTNSLGEAYYASGYNWFCSFNALNLLIGRALFLTSPTNTAPAIPFAPTLVIRPAASGGSTITVNMTNFGANIAAHLTLSFRNSIGNLTSQNKPKLVWLLDNVPGATTDITAEVEASFGDPIVGQRVFFALNRVSAQGRIGLPSTGNILVT